ncbi:MAG TPA: hypothetical protein VGQ00_02610 [Candidatus Norongarragalinales archaeon]|jgi:ribosomal protein S26|nr:hypothetical protein [Candidatus Norongarragalinales archaeon]
MGRGRERLVRCEKCGRETRRDKAVFIEKQVFSNPLERKDVYDETYQRGFYREVAYCPGCGKHLRIYQKKIEQNIREAERAERREHFARQNPNRGGFRKFSEKRFQQERRPEPSKVVDVKTVSETTVENVGMEEPVTDTQ